MNCPECANPIEKGARFCPKCFARIEPPSLWRRFLSLFQASDKPQRRISNIQKTVTIKTTDKDGLRHEYHSLDEVPRELREEIKKLESEAMKETGDTMISETAEGLTSRFVSKKTISVFKVKDASGNERTYHSLDELPPEIRKAIERAQSGD